MVVIRSLIGSLVNSLSSGSSGESEPAPSSQIMDRFGSVINDRSGSPINAR